MRLELVGSTILKVFNKNPLGFSYFLIFFFLFSVFFFPSSFLIFFPFFSACLAVVEAQPASVFSYAPQDRQ